MFRDIYNIPEFDIQVRLHVLDWNVLFFISFNSYCLKCFMVLILEFNFLKEFELLLLNGKTDNLDLKDLHLCLLKNLSDCRRPT